MRISDWSSDVCSSDLLVDHVIYHSGLLAHYQNERDGVDRLENLQELVNAAQMFVSDEKFDGMPAGRIPDIGASPGGPDPDLPLSDPASAGAGHDGASVVSEPRGDGANGAPDTIDGQAMSPLAAFLTHASLEAGENQAQAGQDAVQLMTVHARSEEHKSELQSLLRISYPVFCLKQKSQQITT